MTLIFAVFVQADTPQLSGEMTFVPLGKAAVRALAEVTGVRRGATHLKLPHGSKESFSLYQVPIQLNLAFFETVQLLKWNAVIDSNAVY
jgi:hypothetical protein